MGLRVLFPPPGTSQTHFYRSSQDSRSLQAEGAGLVVEHSNDASITVRVDGLSHRSKS